MDSNGAQDNAPTRSSNPNSPRRTPRFDLAPLATLSDTDTAPSSPEPLATPTLAESYGQLKKNLSFKSLRDLEMRELRGHIYRRGNPSDGARYRPKNSDEVFAHALKGGLRAFRISRG